MAKNKRNSPKKPVDVQIKEITVFYSVLLAIMVLLFGGSLALMILSIVQEEVTRSIIYGIIMLVTLVISIGDIVVLSNVYRLNHPEI